MMPLRNSSAVGSVLCRFGLIAWCVFGIQHTLVGEQQITLRSGLIVPGAVVPIASLDQNPFAAGAGGVQVLSILMIDDGLRRTYVHKSGMVAEANPGKELATTLEFDQPTPLGGQVVAGIGPLLEVSPFNDYGRRVVNLRGPEGNPLSIIQGIAEINSRYARVEALTSKPSYTWDMRIATDSIPPEQLRSILTKRIDQTNYGKRLEVVRFYIDCQRLSEARNELERIIKDFPDEPRLVTQLQALVQRQGTQLLDEAKTRRDAGQYELAMGILKNFPLAEVARVTGLEVQDTIATIEGRINEGTRLLTQLEGQIETLGDGAAKDTLRGMLVEMKQSLSLDTMARLNDYSRLGGVDNIPVDNRISLAVGGWLLGPSSGLQNLAVAISLVEVRSLVAQYLACDDEATRKAILEKLRDLEGAEPAYVAKMLPLLVPPKSLPDEAKDAKIAGMYLIDEKTTGRASGDYVLQLPPEYNPLRSYPCIVALHPIDGTAAAQVDYWQGTPSADGMSRQGQGARHGFVVVAPKWTRPGQRDYESTPREHAEVLSAVRDAMRRVSIDSDRVFLAGLGGGGSAAWDIAVSHPDLWAGMISISGEPCQYMNHYSENASYIPMYFVVGEIAGAPAPLIRQGLVLDRYMAPGFNAMVVMYRGRGGEHFYEEIHKLFDWMRLATHRRQAPPKKIEAATMRNGDQFFWWLEMPELKESVVIDPILWEQVKRERTPHAGKVDASIGEGNQIRISQGPAERFIVYVNPEMGVEMDKTITVRYHTRRVDLDFDGSVDFMLEDARTRAERKHPYWASIRIP